MRALTGIIATLVLLCSFPGVAAAEPKDVQSADRERTYTVDVKIDIPAPLQAAAKLAAQEQLAPLAYLIDNGNLVGEYSPESGVSAEKFEANFEETFGTVPFVAAIRIKVTKEEKAKENVAPRTPIRNPSPGPKPKPITGTAWADEATTTSLLLPASSATDWRPNDVEGDVGLANGRAGFMTSYWWHSGSTPQMLPSGFGAEFEINLYGDPSDIASRPNCSFNYKDKFWAKNYGWNWAVYRPDYQGAAITTIGAYADYNDLSDPCNRNSITIGLRYPQKIPLVNGNYGLIVWVSAPLGTESFSKMGGVVQAVSDSYCKTGAGSLMALTDCMGVWAGTWPLVAPQSRMTANPGNNWHVPSKCWISQGKGEIAAQLLPYCGIS